MGIRHRLHREREFLMADTACCSMGVKKHSLLYIVIVSALGGFLFGFDSGVISGCEKAIQAEFQLSGFWRVHRFRSADRHHHRRL